MAAEKQDPTFFEWFVAPLLMIFVVSSLLGGVIILGWKPEHARLEIILFCGLIVVMVTLLAVLHNQVLGHYRCPQCHAELPRHKDEARQRERLFYCKDCDVLWKTG